MSKVTVPEIKSLCLSVAGFVIEMRFNPTEPPFFTENSFYLTFQRSYPGFLITNPPKVDHTLEFYDQTSFEVIIKNNRKDYFVNFYKKVTASKTITFYHISERQFAVILRNIIQQQLVLKKGLYIHASAVLVGNKASVFLGKSGAGKSTIAKMVSQKYQTLGDDSVILKQRNKSGFGFFQTPVFEKNILIKRYKTEYELGGLFFLKKSLNYSLIKIGSNEKKIELLSKQFLTDQETLMEQMPIILKLVATHKNFYLLEFGLDNPEKVIELLKGYER